MQTRLEVKRIELFSLFKVAFFIYTFIGLVVGLIYGFVLLVAGGLHSMILGEQFPQLGAFGAAIGILAIPFVAMVYGAIGSVFVTIGGIIYNLIAGAVGGVRFETKVILERPEPSVPKSAPKGTPKGGSITPVDGPTLTKSKSFLDDVLDEKK
ncbi:MAG: hypothetical protein JSW50_13045 [Candidatus Latescibacterota bacterium]|nr:MAG: hypothetical protein JSW50_13045 [Candidatus Latescibacterota bacterium]